MEIESFVLDLYSRSSYIQRSCSLLLCQIRVLRKRFESIFSPETHQFPNGQATFLGFNDKKIAIDVKILNSY